MKILFLDVDGVLNHRASFKAGEFNDVICPKAWGRCRQVVEKTGARIVLSSTWRRTSEPETDRHVCKLRSIGLFDYTHEDWRTRFDLPGELYGYAMRGNEIAEWLSRHPEVSCYAIVDDDSDMLREQRPFFVQTHFDTGMMDKHRDALIALLSDAANERMTE